MKFSLKDAHKFGWEGLEGWAYNSVDDFAPASAAYFIVTGSHGKVKTEVSDRVYFVVEGRGIFVIDGKETHVEKDDVIIVPKNTPYDYKAEDGEMRLLLVHAPAYNPDKEILLK